MSQTKGRIAIRASRSVAGADKNSWSEIAKAKQDARPNAQRRSPARLQLISALKRGYDKAGKPFGDSSARQADDAQSQGASQTAGGPGEGEDPKPDDLFLEPEQAAERLGKPASKGHRVKLMPRRSAKSVSERAQGLMPSVAQGVCSGWIKRLNRSAQQAAARTLNKQLRKRASSNT